MNGKTPPVSWPMLAILGSVFAYTAYSSSQSASEIGSIKEQVISTTKEIGEAKLATASLAAQAVLQQQALAEANTVLRERVAKLETLTGAKK
jgi:hypothetical protein